MLKMFDRDTNKSFDKDITDYLGKYHCTTTRASISTKPSSSTSTNTSASWQKYKTKYIKKYVLQPLPQAQPLHHSHNSRKDARRPSLSGLSEGSMCVAAVTLVSSGCSTTTLFCDRFPAVSILGCTGPRK